MPIDSAPSTVATNALQAIPYSALIGGPLDACIKAQAMAAQTTWEFIQNVGLTKDPRTGETKAVSVSFQYQRNGQMFNLIVPLLAIVPIPYIAIDTITIDFKANISASSSTVNEDTTSTEYGGEASGSASVGFGPFTVRLNFKANYSSKKDSKATQESKYSVEYTMDIHVQAGQADMPAGLATVLNILQSSITEAEPTGSLKLSPPEITLDLSNPEASAMLQATVLDGQGMRQKGVDIKYEWVGGTAPAGVKAGPASPGKTDDKGLFTMTLAFDTTPPTAPATAEMAVIIREGTPDERQETAKVFIIKSA
jgi:hypothetical protein